MHIRTAFRFVLAALSLSACAGNISEGHEPGPQIIDARRVDALQEGETLDIDLTIPESSYVLDATDGPIQTSLLRLVLPDGVERSATGWHGLPELLANERWEIVAQTDPDGKVADVGVQQQALKSTGPQFTCVPDVGCIGVGAWDCRILQRSCDGVFTIARGPGGGVACYCD